jgi:hypothetical protein
VMLFRLAQELCKGCNVHDLYSRYLFHSRPGSRSLIS